MTTRSYGMDREMARHVRRIVLDEIRRRPRSLQARTRRADQRQIVDAMGWFPAMINENVVINAGRRWRYGFVEMELASVGGQLVPLVKPGGRTQPAATGAYNLREWANQGAYAWDVNTSGPAYPATFHPQPIGGGYVSAGDPSGHRSDTLVWMRQTYDSMAMAPLFTFSAMGAHDGECPAT